MNSTFAQEAKVTCEVHPKNDIDMYCNTCEKQLCSKCVKQNHRLHEWETLVTVLKKKSLEATSLCKNVRENYVPRFQGFIENLKKAKLDVSQRKQHTIEKVNFCKTRIIRATEDIAEKITMLIDSENQEINARLDNDLSVLEKEVQDIEAIVETMDQNKTSGKDSGILELEECLKTKIQHIKEPDLDQLTRCSHFIEGPINTKTIETTFGYIQDEYGMGCEARVLLTNSNDPRTVEIADYINFTHTDRDITEICAISGKEAWIYTDESKSYDMLTIEGKEVNQIDMGQSDGYFVVGNERDIIFTDYNGCTINRISSTGQRTTLVDTAPLHPWGISLSVCGDLLVTLMDAKNYCTHDDSQRLVRRITTTGKIKATYRTDKERRSQLFTVPHHVRQNCNYDICVLDGTSENSGQLHVLCEDGRLKRKYSGEGIRENFQPTDVVCDYNRNILVSDRNNHCIHLLHHSGEFLTLLVTAEDGLQYPNSICLHRGNLWVGCSRGKIRVYKYKF